MGTSAYRIAEGSRYKILASPNYNYQFDKKTGQFARWGNTHSDDPFFSPFGPEICDIEISTICHQGCQQCYKSNTATGENMSLETFKQIFHKLPRTLTQIAFGIGSIDANPDLWAIMDYCRNNDYQEVIPNITINGDRMETEDFVRLTKTCGAVAVSNYDKDTCYNTVLALHAWKEELEEEEATLQQINIHQVLCEDTLNQCMSLLDDMRTDPRLVNRLNAVVFLLLKPKGKRNKLKQLKSMKQYKALIDKALDNNLPFGFDSCGAHGFLQVVKDRPNYKQLLQVAEPCESTLFSIYINVAGQSVPCSFCEGESGFENSIDMLNSDIFLSEVWYSSLFENFRTKLRASQEQKGCRTCPVFDLEMK